MKNTNYLKEELYELIKTDESIFDFIQESSLDGLWYWDLEHPEEEWMNPKFWSVLGYDHREMPHKASAWQDIIYPEDLKLATENFIRHCENPDCPYDQTVRYTHKNGSTVWIRCRGLAVRDKQGKPLRMLGAHQEITAIKNNETMLQRSTSLLRNAQQISKIGSWELDLKTNEVVWTEELYKMYGFDPALPVPPYAEHLKLFTPESWEQLSASLNLTKEQGIPYELELTTVRKDESLGWMWVRGEAVFDENKNTIGLRGVAQDITERKQIEEALKEKDRKIRDLTNNINESSLISITDEKGTIIEINRLFCELSGYTKAELVGQNHRIINSGYHDKQFWLGMWKTIAKGEIWRGEIKNLAKDGSEYWVASVINPVKDHSGKIRQYISIRQDITERKKIEIEKEALAKRLNYALDASGDGIWDWTPSNGITVYSKAWIEMLGYEVGEIASLASEWSDRLHPDDAEWVFATINKVTQAPENGDTFNHEYRFRNKAGDYLWMLNKAKVVERNEKGEASRIVGTHTNITESKNAEAEIKLLNEELEKKILDRTRQLETSNKELESFSYSVAHDLRAPLRAVNSYAQILKEDYEQAIDADGKQVLENIRYNAKKMGSLIDELLTFSRLGRKEIHKTAIDLNTMLLSIVDDLKRTTELHADIQIASMPAVQADYTLLQQVFVNLLSNAIKYSAKKEHPVVEIFAEQQDGKTVFAVKDNGAGFDMQFADKLFGVFQRLHSEKEFEGNGVGLAIVQRIISKHGGQVWAAGKEHMGATFYFTLN